MWEDSVPQHMTLSVGRDALDSSTGVAVLRAVDKHSKGFFMGFNVSTGVLQWTYDDV